VPKRPVRPPQLVLDNITRVPQQDTPGLLLPLDHATHHADQLVRQLLLERPSVVWFEIWKKLPSTSLPSPYNPR
jgi:hypothetical protein